MILFAVVMSGCASTVMRETANQQVTPPPPEKAKVVFMRSSIVAAAITSDLFEVVNGELRFIGKLANGTKIAYETTPGEKVFMAYGTAADFMLANLAPGKTYYAVVRPNWGTGGFAPTPIRSDRAQEPNLYSNEFKEWFSVTKLVEPNESAPAWFAENKAQHQRVYADYWSKFSRKSNQEKAERTLQPQDGK